MQIVFSTVFCPFDLGPRGLTGFFLESMSKHYYRSIKKAQNPESIPAELDSAFPDIVCQFLQVLFRNCFQFFNQLKHPSYLLCRFSAQRIEEFLHRALPGRYPIESNRFLHQDKLASTLTYVNDRYNADREAFYR